MQEKETIITSQTDTIKNEGIIPSDPETVTQSEPKRQPETIPAHTTDTDSAFHTGETIFNKSVEGKESYSRFMYRPDTEMRLHKIYQDRELSRVMGNDLRRIQSVDPTVADLEDLPDEYIAFRFNKAMPLDAVSAYKAMQAVISGRKPPSTGAMTGSATNEKEFYTSEELDRLTKADLDDPNIMAKAIRSMGVLK